MKNIILLFIYLLCPLILSAQAASFSWAKSIGSNMDQVPNSVLSDAAGNVFVLGNYNGTPDFDPGAGTYTMTPSSGNVDAFLVKLDASGNFVWAKTFGNEAQVGQSQSTMSFDPAGNIIITGMYIGTGDFDPGPATYTLGSAGNFGTSSYLLKLDANGNFMWAKGFQGVTFMDIPIFSDVRVDANGDIHIIGCYYGQFDGDPDPSTTQIIGPSTQGYYSYVALKLNSSGNFIWGKSINAAMALGNPLNLSLTTDQQSNVLITGSFSGTVDFDPGAGTYNLSSGSTSSQGSSFVLKLNASGNFVWAGHTDCPGGAWAANKDLVCDNAGNVYVCGWGAAPGTDLDPGPAVFNYPGTTATEQGYIFKLDPAGNFVWGNFISGDKSSACASITFNSSGELCILGDYVGTFDFDGGAGTFTQTSASAQTNTRESFMCSYNSAGGFLWANSFGGSTGGVSFAKSIAGSNTGIYATGYFNATADYDPTAGISTLNVISGKDTYILKLTVCTAPPTPTNTTLPANRSICAGATTTLSVSSSTGTVNWYASPTSTTAIGSGTVYTTPALAAGTYTYYADATTCGPSATRAAITVTATVFPTITASTFSSTICSGSSATLTANSPSAVTYSWSTGASTASITVSPTVTTSYTVTGTNACATASTSVTQYVSTCTGIDEFISTEAISIYPNPANELVSIAIPDYLASASTWVEVSDALGKLVMKEILTHDINTFNISGLEDGIYFFKVLSNKQSIKTGKVVKH